MNDAHSLIAIAPLMLGQLSAVTATELGQWLFCAACVFVILNYGIALFKNLTGGFARKPSPAAEGTPTWDECDKRHAAIANRFAALQSDWKRDRQDLHSRINTIAEGVAFIRGQFETKRAK